MLCCVVLCCVVLCCVVLCCVVLCCVELSCVVLCCAVLCCVVLCCVVLGMAVLLSHLSLPSHLPPPLPVPTTSAVHVPLSASYFRLKYPDVVHGVVAGSAPIWAFDGQGAPL